MIKKNDEVLSSEEKQNMNSLLEKNEKYEMASSLLPENIKKITDMSQNKKKFFNSKIFISTVSTVAALAIVVGTVFAIPSLRNNIIKSSDTSSINMNLTTNSVGAPVATGYEEIENMFLYYHDKGVILYNAEYSGISGDVIYKDNDTIEAAEEEISGEINANKNDSLTDATNNFGSTNEQVDKVSEADILKNDGKYIYTVKNYEDYEDGNSPTKSTVNITSVDKDGYFTLVSSINPESDKDLSDVNIHNIYVEGNTLIIISVSYLKDNNEKETDYICNNNTSKYVTVAYFYDISNKESPVYLNKYRQSGNYSSSRYTDEHLILISNYYVNVFESEEALRNSCIPKSGNTDDDYDRIDCDNILISDNMNSTSYLVVSNIDVSNADNHSTVSILGAGENYYCSTENLYCTSTNYDSCIIGVEESIDDSESVTSVELADNSYSTQIIKYIITDGNIEYVGETTIDGMVNNQYSLDEYEGNLRIATFDEYFSVEGKGNNIYVLDESLTLIGSITGFGVGETIKSVRFSENMGYVVTFRQTDPLFTIDLSNPSSPVISGELMVTGYSGYLHPITENLMIGFGESGTEDGLDGGLKISLFDVSDSSNPVEIDYYSIEANESTEYDWLASDALNDYMAICYDSLNTTIYIPYYGCRDIVTDNHCSEITNSLFAIKIDTESKKLICEPLNNVAINKSQDYYSISRITFINDIVIAFSRFDNNLYSLNKNTGNLVDTIS